MTITPQQARKLKRLARRYVESQVDFELLGSRELADWDEITDYRDGAKRALLRFIDTLTET